MEIHVFWEKSLGKVSPAKFLLTVMGMSTIL